MTGLRREHALGGRDGVERGLLLAALAFGCREGSGASASATAALPSGATASPAASVAVPLAAPPSGAGAEVSLELIDDFNPPRPSSTGAGADGAPAAAWDAALGGLSGLFYSAPDNLLYAISDDRGRFPAPRLYSFGLELGEHLLRLAPRSVVLLHEPEPTGSLTALDGEGLAGDGRALFLSVEGNEEPPSQRESRVLQLDRDGLVRGSVLVPPAFRPAGGDQPPRGTRANLGFEGLSVSPSGRWLFAMAEAALYQDGPVASFDQGTRVRLARWDLERPGEPLELGYRTDPVEPRLEAPSVAHNGVSELVALDDERLLVLERAYVEAGERRVNTVRIFQVDLAQAAAEGGSPPLLAKRLVLDLNDVVARFDEGQRELDNFEGMTLGPRLASGNPSLLLVSDDNFSARQRTVFVAFELRTR